MSKKSKIFFIATGLVPILGVLSSPPDAMLLIYTVFVAALLYREKLLGTVAKIRLSARWKFLFLMIAAGLLAETLAWTSNYLAREAQPALLHPQLIPDLILGIGFYSGWALSWMIAHRFWRFTLLQVFLATGISGIWTEGVGAAFLNIMQTFLTNPLSALYGILYLVAVYGSIAGLAYLPVAAEFNKSERRNHPLKYPTIWILLFFVAQLTTGVVMILAGFLELIPLARPIWEHPFF